MLILARKFLVTGLLIACLSGHAQQKESFLVNYQDTHYLYLNGHQFNEFFEPGKAFKIVHELGELKESSYEEHFTFKKWEFEFQGIRFTYIDNSGSPILEKLEIDFQGIPKVQIRMKNHGLSKEIDVNKVFKEGDKANQNNSIRFKKISNPLSIGYYDEAYFNMILEINAKDELRIC